MLTYPHFAKDRHHASRRPILPYWIPNAHQIIRCDRAADGTRKLGMSLTFQPFAEIPELDNLRTELYHNVSSKERLGSLAAGVAVALGGIPLGGVGRALLLSAGAALIYRGASGHCPVYERLGVNTRGANTTKA